MREVDMPRGEERAKVICTWCGDTIRPAAAKPARRMCQSCFARMMSEHSRAHRLHEAGRRDVSER